MFRMDLNLFGREEDQAIEELNEMKADWLMDDNTLVVEVAKLTQLRRIANALEKISDNLDYLNSCVVYVPPRHFQTEGYHFLRIGGQIETE